MTSSMCSAVSARSKSAKARCLETLRFFTRVPVRVEEGGGSMGRGEVDGWEGWGGTKGRDRGRELVT